jgi:hypothetical protein
MINHVEKIKRKLGPIIGRKFLEEQGSLSSRKGRAMNAMSMAILQILPYS